MIKKLIVFFFWFRNQVYRTIQSIIEFTEEGLIFKIKVEFFNF